MATYTLEPTGDDSFDVLRDGQLITHTGGRDFAERMLIQFRDQELEARTALATDDLAAVCAIGWHRGGLPERIENHLRFSGHYFHYETKIGEAGGTLVYRIGQLPFLYLSRSVKTIGSVTPWTCAVCGKDVGPD